MPHDYDIIADENVDIALIKKLQRSGLNVFSILENQPGITDEEVLSIANSHKAIILTEDKDFGELTYKRKIQNYGIILIRLSNMTRNERNELVVNMIISNFKRMQNHFVVFSNQGLRIKSL